LNNTSKTVLKSEDNYRFHYDNKFEDKSAEGNKPAFVLQPVEYSSKQTPADEVLSRVKNSTQNSRVEELSRVEKERSQRSKDEYPPY